MLVFFLPDCRWPSCRSRSPQWREVLRLSLNLKLCIFEHAVVVFVVVVVVAVVVVAAVVKTNQKPLLFLQ